MTLNDVMTADPRYLYCSLASCCFMLYVNECAKIVLCGMHLYTYCSLDGISDVTIGTTVTVTLREYCVIY